ncbi:hypothetical protein U0534_20915 [Bacillus atrophaeus]|nr:hypothetical protein [Bacillus atrophaeus]MCM3457565.1 hypothetical protein [Bacillus atrophaeus]MDR4396307.1 hypothetical protein [Bacillus atrophaeus]MEC1731571.1 hypothetical protein [Bacillus atrophaeus]MEC1857299.1 hypothetical protein [Bacillus atrophaeus]MEC2359943.1 hypothetical protein [Bacillus atrophaeus]
MEEKDFETNGYGISVFMITKSTHVKYGRCDNCDYTLFKSSVKSGVFLRECRRCGMKKRDLK